MLVSTYTTETGSVYELCSERMIVRRMSSTHAPTKRQGTDGKWQSMESFDFAGDNLIINWVDGHCTITSSIVNTDIYESLNEDSLQAENDPEALEARRAPLIKFFPVPDIHEAHGA